MERISVTKAAVSLGVSKVYLYKLIKQKRLQLHKDKVFGISYLLVDDVEAYRRSDRRPGRKPAMVNSVLPNSDKSISDVDSTVYDFFTDRGL